MINCKMIIFCPHEQFYTSLIVHILLSLVQGKYLKSRYNFALQQVQSNIKLKTSFHTVLVVDLYRHRLGNLLNELKKVSTGPL